MALDGVVRNSLILKPIINQGKSMINVAKCNLGEVKLQTMLASGLLLESGDT